MTFYKQQEIYYFCFPFYFGLYVINSFSLEFQSIIVTWVAIVLMLPVFSEVSVALM